MTDVPTVTMCLIEVEFTGADPDWLYEMAKRYGEHGEGFKLDIFSKTFKEREGKPVLIVTYTNPAIPWLSPDEPLTITLTNDEHPTIGELIEEV